MEGPHYSMLIEWSDADQAYIVSFPEWERTGYLANTHGATYAEAASKGEETLGFLMESTPEAERPTPVTFDSHAYAPGETAETLARKSERLSREIEQWSEHNLLKPPKSFTSFERPAPGYGEEIDLDLTPEEDAELSQAIIERAATISPEQKEAEYRRLQEIQDAQRRMRELGRKSFPPPDYHPPSKAEP